MAIIKITNDKKENAAINVNKKDYYKLLVECKLMQLVLKQG